MRWRALGGLLVVIIVLATLYTHCSGSASKSPTAAPGSATTDDDHGQEQPPLAPGEIRVVPPEGLEANSHAAHDWERIVDELYKHHYRQARDKLDEWEEHWGPTPETADLKKQLEQLPDDEPRPHGRGKHGRPD